MSETVRLAHDVDGEGPLLVLVHGITEDRRSWDPVPLYDHFRVVRVSGLSPRRRNIRRILYFAAG